MAAIMELILITRPVLYLYSECAGYFYKKAFLVKYELEDFSQFNGVSLFIRGLNKDENIVIIGDASYLVNDSSKVVSFGVMLDKENNKVVKIWLYQHEYYIIADTVKLQQLAQTFMKYEIPRLNVDKEGNVFVYLKNFETLAFARFVDNSEFFKRYHKAWENIKGNWYKPKS